MPSEHRLILPAASEFARVRALNAPPAERVALFATVARLATLTMIARAGSGHIGSSFSSLDIVSWLLLEELERSDRAPGLYFSSKGHDVPGLYAVLAGLGRLPFDSLTRLRRLGGLPGHPDVSVPGIAANTGSLGMGISKAKGMLLAARLKGQARRLFVLTGDGELQEGQIWESLLPCAHARLGELTVIVDHNRMQSDTHVAKVSDLGDLEARFAAHGWHAARCDGHDLGALAGVLDGFARITDRPKALIAETVKGRGVSFMEHTAMPPDQEFYRFHSGAPSPADYALAAAELRAEADRRLDALGAGPLVVESIEGAPAAPAGPRQRLVAAYGQALIEAAARRPEIVALDADLVLDTGLIPFRERFPDRFFECGIAEQDMVSTAGGMALAGLLPFVHSFACFLSTRPNEQIYANASERRRVVHVGSLAGLLPAGPGHSHQSVRDVSALAAVPGLVMVQPGCEAETRLAVAWAADRAEASVYIRLVSIPVEVTWSLPDGYELDEGRGVALTEGGDAVLVTHGPVMLGAAIEACALLRERGVGLKVVNLPWLNRLDAGWLAGMLAGTRTLVTLDDHYLIGGQGQMVLAALAEHGLSPGLTVRRLGLADFPACGRNDEVASHHGLDAAGIARTVRAALGDH